MVNTPTLSPDLFNYAANAGVNIDELYNVLGQMGASQEQIQGFIPWMQQTFGDPAGQFGKYANGDVIGANLAKYLQTGDTTGTDYAAADPGHGGWLSHNLGDVLHWANPLDVATGGAWNQWSGNAGNWIYDHTLGNLGGWVGDHVYGDDGMLSNFSRFSSAGGDPGAAYQGAIQRGATPEQAAAITGGDVATAAAIAGTVLSAGAGSPLLGAAVAGGGTALGGAMAGRPTGQTVRDAALAALASYGTGQISPYVTGLAQAAGASPGVAGVVGSTVTGAGTGALRAGVSGQNIGQGAATGAVGGLLGSAGSTVGGNLGGQFGSAVGGQLGSFGAGLLNHALFSPNQPGAPPPQGGNIANQPPSFGGFSFGPQQSQPRAAYQQQPMTLDPTFARLYGANQSAQLLGLLNPQQQAPQMGLLGPNTQFPINPNAMIAPFGAGS